MRYLPALLLLLCSSICSAGETVRVTLLVTVPTDTDSKAKVYVAGNLKEVGEWRADGIALKRADSGAWKLEIDLPKGATLEYKINCGSWDSVEKGPNGEEVENRKLSCDADKTENITVASWRKPGPRVSTATGDIRYHRDFQSKALRNSRQLIVWLPPGYESDKATRYPVLYLHDGQNCFDEATGFAGEWKCDETAAELIQSGEITPIIMVAVENTGANRTIEYTSGPDLKSSTVGGGAETYARFLIEEVKPFIDEQYRTLADRKHTAVAGSSLGGLVSLYLGLKHHDVFSMFGVLSPSLWWNNGDMINRVRDSHDWMKDSKVWLDMGTDEGEFRSARLNLDDCRALVKIFTDAGFVDGRQFIYREFDGARHNEAAWSARFPQVLRYFFGK